MILSELRDYLKNQRRASINELSVHFQIDAEALRGMLGKWIGKGKIKQTKPNAACGGGCCRCDPLLTEMYEWVD